MPQVDPLDAYFNKAVADGVFPGAVLHARDRSGNFNYSKAYGKLALGDGAPDMQTDSIMQIAACTALMTSIAALQCVERGLIRLDDDVSRLLPEIGKQEVLRGFDDAHRPKLRSRKRRIRLRYLLSHSAGLGYELIYPVLAMYRALEGHAAGSGSTVKERFLYPLTYEPGSSWGYGVGLDWTGKLIEKLTGESLEDYMRKNIWEPLGINRITFFPSRHPEMKVAQLTSRDQETGRLIPNEEPFLNEHSTEEFGGHGAYADLSDYVKILHSILCDDEVLLRKETAARMFQPQLTKESKMGLQDVMSMPEASAMLVGDFPRKIDYDWGIGGLLVQQDNVRRRKKGTLIWSGMPHVFWFIDREAGLCGVFGTQVLPPGDLRVEETIRVFELAMNERLVAANLAGQ